MTTKPSPCSDALFCFLVLWLAVGLRSLLERQSSEARESSDEVVLLYGSMLTADPQRLILELPAEDTADLAEGLEDSESCKHETEQRKHRFLRGGLEVADRFCCYSSSCWVQATHTKKASILQVLNSSADCSCKGMLVIEKSDTAGRQTSLSRRGHHSPSSARALQSHPPGMQSTPRHQ